MRVLYTLLSSVFVLVLAASQAFSQCDQVTQGDPVANSGCLICPFPAAGITGNNTFATPTLGGGWCTSIENDEFIGFTAICTSVQFGVQVSNCAGGTNGDGLQIAIVDSDFNLFGCTSGVANGSTYSATVPTCGDYYIRIDGVSGSGCDYTITPAAGVLDENYMAPTTPATVVGRTFLCADETAQYQYNPAPSTATCPGGSNPCSALCWDISFSSPLLATEVTADPTDAFGFGCADNQASFVDLTIGDLSALPPGSQDTIFLSATPDFGCAGPGVQSQVLEIIVSRPPDSFAIVFTCPGEDYFLDGTGYAPGGHVVELFDNAGCPFDLNLNVQTFPPNFGPTLPLAVCGLSGVTICPTDPIVNPPAGLNTCNLGPIAANGCDSLIQYDVYYLDPMAVINAPDTALDCITTSVTASVNPGSTQGDTVAYNWTTAGGTFSANADNTVITITDAGTYYLEVSMWSDADPTQTCEARDTIVVTSLASNPLDTPMIVGPIGVCIGATASYSTTADPSFTAYNWTAVGASSSTPSGNMFDVIWNTAGTYDVCLTVQNVCETSEERCIQVVVGNDQPTFTLEGATAACENGEIALGITPFIPGITYTITGTPPGSTAILDADTVRVSVGTMGGSICITGQGNCGPSTEECVAISINSSAAAPEVTGPTPVCVGDTVTYQITADPLIASTSWTITGGTIISSTATEAIVTWSVGAGREICAEITDDCGVVQQDCLPVLVNQGPSGTMRGGGTYCAGNNDVTIEIDLIGQAPFTITYLLDGTTQTATTNASPFVLNNPAPGTYVLTAVSDATGCPGIVSGSAVVIEDALPTAVLSGAFDLCANSGDQIMFDVFLTGNAPWTLELALGGAALTPVTVNASPYTVTVTTPGTYTVNSLTDDTSCPGTGSGSVVITERQPVTVNTVRDSCLPNNAGFIVIVELANGDVATYQNTGADPGSFVGNVFTSDPLPSGSGYSFIFSDQYGCSPQTVAQAIVNCNCNNDAGTMARDTASLCGPGVIILPAGTSGAGSMGEQGDVLTYYLHSGAFGSLVGVLDSALTPRFTFDPARYNLDQVYYVSSVSGDITTAGYPDRADPCLDVALGQPIVWRSLPTVQLNAVSDACAGEEAIATLLLTGNFPLTVDYTLGGVAASQTFAASPASLRVTVPAVATTLTITDVTDRFGCSIISNASIGISPLEEVAIANVTTQCDGAGLNYTVTFEITAGDLATVVILPAGSGTLSGTTFTSNPIPEGTGYSFTVSDDNMCNTVPVTAGSVNCDCISMVAPIMQTLEQVCGATPITVSHSHAGSTLDSDDITGYVLHSSNGTTLGTVFAQSNAPTFNIDIGAGMVFGTTYYISPVVGNAGGGGSVDLSDPCLSVAAGTPVLWEDGPTAELQGETVICEGGSTMITFVFTGDGPFTANMVTSDGGRDTTFTTPGPTVSYFVSPTTGTIYVLTEVSTAGCTIFPNDTVQIDVDQILTAGTFTAGQAICANDDSQIDLANLLTGADAGGTYSQTGGPASTTLDPTTGVFVNSGLTGGQYTFTYTVGSGGVCPTDDVSLTVDLTPAPTADAGLDQMLTCDETTATLGGPATSTGAGISYAWTGGPVADATAAQTTTTTSGTYTLTVTDAAGGCTVNEDVIIDISNDRPNSVDVSTSPVDCDGGPTGRIFANNVSGGTAPYRFTLDGGIPALTGEFANLNPGTYTLLITDANGCAYEEDITIDPASQVGVGAGPDIELSFGESQTIQLLTTGNITEIMWTGGPFTCVDSNFCDEITITPTFSTTYSVTVVDTNGCEASDALQVIVRRERPIFAPTAFSPNGDANNDIFFLRSPEGVVENISSFQVFDRWGESVFRLNNIPPNDPMFGWDGTLDGEFLNPAVFIFVAEVEFTDGVKETIKGDFTLLR